MTTTIYTRPVIILLGNIFGYVVSATLNILTLNTLLGMLPVFMAYATNQILGTVFLIIYLLLEISLFLFLLFSMLASIRYVNVLILKDGRVFHKSGKYILTPFLYNLIFRKPLNDHILEYTTKEIRSEFLTEVLPKHRCPIFYWMVLAGEKLPKTVFSCSFVYVHNSVNYSENNYLVDFINPLDWNAHALENRLTLDNIKNKLC